MNYFDKIILSDDIGVNKPNSEIFQYAIKRVNTTEENVAMIGDSWDADIIGAKNSKIDQIWSNPLHENNNGFVPTHTIYSLLELKDIL